MVVNLSLRKVKMAYGLDDIDLASLKVSKISRFTCLILFSCLNYRIEIHGHTVWSLARLLGRSFRFLLK